MEAMQGQIIEAWKENPEKPGECLDYLPLPGFTTFEFTDKKSFMERLSDTIGVQEYFIELNPRPFYQCLVVSFLADKYGNGGQKPYTQRICFAIEFHRVIHVIDALKECDLFEKEPKLL